MFQQIQYICTDLSEIRYHTTYSYPVSKFNWNEQDRDVLYSITCTDHQSDVDMSIQKVVSRRTGPV